MIDKEHQITSKKDAQMLQKSSHHLSNTDIDILKCGLKWIREKPDEFSHSLYNSLSRSHQNIQLSLISMGPQSFRIRIIRALELTIGDLLFLGAIRPPMTKYWRDVIHDSFHPANHDSFQEIVESFLEALSALAEDAWCPAMEAAWRKAIAKVKSELS